jgi:transposase-like protein
MVTQTLDCRHCGSTQLIRHGRASNGKQRYLCQACGRTSRENPGSAAYDESTKAQILAAYQERASLRGLTRIFGVSRTTVISWLKKSQHSATVGAYLGPRTGARDTGTG